MPALVARTNANAKALSDWIDTTPWVDYVAVDPAARSTTSICMKIVDPDLSSEQQGITAKAMNKLLAEEDAAYDIGAYRDAPPGLRVWTGATVETANISALTLWLDWAFAATRG